jgi:hypothetical protein
VVLLNEMLYPTYLWPIEPAAVLQSNGVKPEFRKAISTLNMNMEWLMPITRIEKETIWPGSKYCWHVFWLAARRIE